MNNNQMSREVPAQQSRSQAEAAVCGYCGDDNGFVSYQDML